MHGMKPTSLPQPVVDASEEGSIQMSSPSNSPSQGSPMMGVGSSPKLMKDEPLLRGTSMALLEFSSVMHPEDSKAQLKDHAQTMLQKIKHEDVLVRVVQMLENTVDSTTTTSSPSTDGPTSSHSHSPHSGSRGQETSEALSRSTGATYASRQESFHQPKRNNVARCSDASNALQRFQDELNKRSHSVETFSDRDSIPFMEEEKGGDDTSTAYSPNEAAGKRRDRGVSFVGSNEDYHHDPSKRRSTWGSSMMMEDPLCSSAHCLPMRAGRREAISGAPISLPFSGTASPVSVISLTLPSMSKTEMDFVRKAVESWNDFEDLDEDDLQALAAGMKEEICPAGSTLCEEGNSSTEKIYLLVEGTCTVVRMSKPVATIHPGEFIATRELMYSGASCSSTIQCVTRCVFYALEEELYRGFICASSQKRRERYAGLVQGSPFLQTLDEKGRLILAEALVSSTFAKGDPIIKFGEKGMKMHFILDGEVRVVGRQSGKKVEVLRLGKGEVVGELEFLFNHLAVADVIAASESVTTAFISRAHFEMLFGEIQERLKEYVATNVLYQEYYRNGIANKSVMKELQRFEQSHSHHEISSSPQSSPTTAAKANTTNLSNNNNITAVTSGNRPGELFPPPVVTPHRVSPLNKHGEIVLLAPSTDIRLSTSMETSARRGGELTTPAPPPDLFHFALPQILLSTGVALIGLREDGLILVWSETMVRLTNYAAEDVVGLNIYTFLANEAEQRSMHAAIEDVQLRSGDGSPTLKVTHTASTINNTYTFTRSDGLTRVRLRLQLFFPVEAPESRNMLLAAGEEIKQDPRRALEQPLWLSSHLRTILLDEGFSYEERLQLIAERISSFEVMHRAMSVSMDTLRVVDVREMVGQMVMDFGSECVQRGVSVSQCYDGLTSELAYLDPQRLPECLRYAMNLCLKLPDCSELSITCSLADSSGVELLIIHFDVDGAGFPDAFVKLLDMPLPAANPEKDLVLGCSTSREEQLLLLRARKAVEQQGATMRLRNCDGASNLIFIIPYLPVDGGDDGWNQSISDDEDDFRGDGTAPEDACSTTVVGGDSLQATRGFSMVLEPTQGPEVSQQNFTTLVAEDLPSHRNVICGFLWRRRHAVLPAYNLADVERLAGVADILIIDPHQSILANLPTSDPIALLREKTHRMAVIVTGRGMDAATSEAYTRAGFIPLNKNCTPHEAMQAIRLAEDRVKAAKVEAQRIATARETLAKNSRGAWERGKLLGKGSFGEVFLAVDVLTGGTMAVKEMRLDNSNLKLENFIAEISTMCSLQHPHIIHYFYCEQDAERHTLRVFMEYAAGGTLQGLLSRKEKLDFAEYQSLLRDITEGLAYIHHHRYVHGDIKTANVLLDNGNRGKIGDFGTARTLAEGKLIFEMQGSPLYMSPECMSAGEVDEDGEKIGYSFPSDIWSLGCVAMEMATNRPPFSHVSSVKGPAGLTQYVTSLHDIPDLSPLFEWPPSVVEFVAACLNPDPLRRATAQELLEFSIFSDGSDEDTKSAMKALKRAQLLHVLNKFVAFQDPEEVEQLQMEHQQRLRGCQRNCTDFFDSSSSSGSSSSRSTKHNSSSDDEDDDEFERLTKKHVGRRAAMKEAEELEKGESITSPDLQHLETAAFPTSDDRTASMADDAPHQVVEHTFEPSSTTLTATSQAFSAHSDCDDLSLESGASFHKLEFANASPLRARAASHSSSNARLATSFFGTSMDVLHSAANRFLQHLGEERRPIHVNTNINVSNNNNNNTSAKDGHAPLQLSATIPDTSVASLMSSDPLNSTTRIRQSPKSLFMVKVKKRFQMGESSIDSRRPNLSFFHTRAATSSPPTTPGVSAGVGAATRTKITCSPKSSPHNSRQQASHHSMSVQSALKDAFSELGELLHHGGKQRGSASASASHPASPDVSRESGAAVSSTITPASTAFEDASFSTSAGDVSEATSPGVSPQGAEDEVESSNSIKKTNAMRNIMRHVKHLKKYISDLKEHSIHDE